MQATGKEKMKPGDWITFKVKLSLHEEEWSTPYRGQIISIGDDDWVQIRVGGKTFQAKKDHCTLEKR